MKRTLTLSGLLFVSALAFAGDPEKQDSLTTDDGGSRNSVLFKKTRDRVNGIPEAKFVFKWNLSPIIFTEFAFQAEYAFHKNMSGALGFAIMPARGLPSPFISGAQQANQFLTSSKVSHWSITPEFRYYPGKKEVHQAPHGFYVAPYFRYEKYKYTASYRYTTGDKKDVGVDFTATYGGPTFGLMVGAQWRITQNLYFDWWIVGGGGGTASFVLDSQLSGATLSQANQDEVKKSLEENFGLLSSIVGGKPTVTVTSTSAKAELSGLPNSSLRLMGFCFGFAF
jgi:hypothetical protein